MAEALPAPVTTTELSLASLSEDTLDLVLARCSVQSLCCVARTSRRMHRHVCRSEALWKPHFQSQCAPHGSAVRGGIASKLAPRGWRQALRGWLSYNPLACAVVQLPGDSKAEIFGVSLAPRPTDSLTDLVPTRLWAVDSLGALHEHHLHSEGPHSSTHVRSVRVLNCAALAVEACEAEILVAGSGAVAASPQSILPHGI